ncbi:MAG: transcription antitermination factor NusB, partial [Bacteroidales bacterium]|nr:transcription antitermination factor NusB [Bacteroidales bacterium]
MANDNVSYKEDKELVSSIFVDVIAQNESLYSYLEEQSIYWNDEVEFIIGIIIKTIKAFKPTDGEHAKLLDLFKNSEDESFAKRLFRKVVLNNKEYKEIIEKFCLNWDFDRIAFMDILLMTMAIAEVIEFSSIPTRVTFNEYIELSKYYSTNKSNLFINGLLDKAFKHMKDEKMFVKQGRGLIGEEN